MKKLFLILLFLIRSILSADEYPSLYNGTFLDTLLNDTNFINSGYFVKSYSTVVYTNSAKSATTGKPYYPQGWSKFKIYVPAGLSYASATISTVPNASLRYHIRFGADGNTATDHYSPQTITSFPDNQTVEKIALNVDQFVYQNVSNSGWLYFDVVHDSANSYDEHPTYNGSVTLNIQIVYQKRNTDIFNSWMASTYFLTPLGDPSATSTMMSIIDVETPDTFTSRTIGLDYGGALYNGTPISSSSSAAASSAASSDTSTSSTVSSITTSSSSVSSGTYNPCPSGQYLSSDTGYCTPIGGVSSSVTILSSSSSYYSSASSTCVSGGGILPGGSGTACITSSSASSTASSDPCGTGYIRSSVTGYCVAISSASSSSSSSASSLPTTSMTLHTGWNLISLPIETNDEVDINQTLNGKATIAYKFKYIDTNTTPDLWETWSPPSSTAKMVLKNGEGIFVGIPGSSTQTISFSAKADTNVTTFESLTCIVNRWYLLGFSYDLALSAIKTKYPTYVAWIMQEDGSYLKLDDNSTAIKAGQGFWFKYK